MRYHLLLAGAVFLLFSMVVVSGCAQVSDRKDYMESVIGRDFGSIRGIYLLERRRPAENNWTFRKYHWNEEVQGLPESGLTRYIYTNPYRDCMLVFEVGSNNIVKNTSYTGTQC